MNWAGLFTSFEGRICRQQWWLGTIVLIALVLILYFAIFPLFGLSMITGLDPASHPDALTAMVRKAAIGQLIALALLAYPSTVLMKKRLNDRDRPNWLVYAFWAPTVLSVLANLAGFGMTDVDVGNGVMVPGPTGLGMILGAVGFLVAIWFFVELGFLKGTPGPNRHGPDPLAR